MIIKAADRIRWHDRIAAKRVRNQRHQPGQDIVLPKPSTPHDAGSDRTEPYEPS